MILKYDFVFSLLSCDVTVSSESLPLSLLSLIFA